MGDVVDLYTEEDRILVCDACASHLFTIHENGDIRCGECEVLFPITYIMASDIE